jgi:CRISPR system Cascade subunit CasE
MFLSRLTLNPRNAQVRTELARPYEMHRTLLNAFPQSKVRVERDDDDAAGVLFRVDESPRDNRIVVLVQSQAAPDWSFLNKRDARGPAYLHQPAEFKSFELKLVAGQTLAFRLRANPTKRLGKGAGDDHHKRVGIYDEEGQLKWLRRKAEAGGFCIVRAMVSRDERIENQEAIPRDDRRHDLKLFSVQFDGVLQIVNAADFCKTVTRGIGSAKGFGFGLLSLAPA